MKVELTIGTLMFVGERYGGHVHVMVLGPGEPGHRPLCGRFVVDDSDWASLERAAVEVVFDDLKKIVGAAVDRGVRAITYPELERICPPGFFCVHASKCRGCL